MLDIMLSLDNQGPRLHGNHWSSLLDSSRSSIAMAIMYDVHNRNTHLRRLFRDDSPLQHRAITGYLCSEENVDDSTSLDYVVVVDIVDDTPSESSTAPSVELLCFTRCCLRTKEPRVQILSSAHSIRR